MPKVSQEHRDARRAQILQAAAACFERKGYQRTTMADIIKESGLSAGAIYVYFAGKQDIVRAVAQESVTARVEAITAQAGDGALSPGDLVAAAVASGAAAAPFFAPELWSLARRDDKVRELLGFSQRCARRGGDHRARLGGAAPGDLRRPWAQPRGLGARCRARHPRAAGGPVADVPGLRGQDWRRRLRRGHPPSSGVAGGGPRTPLHPSR